MPRLSYSRALSDPQILGPFFHGGSWDLSKSVVAAMNAEPLSLSTKNLFLRLYRAAERHQPSLCPQWYSSWEEGAEKMR